MKQYKGYYIDHIYFHSTEDIDNYIRGQLVKRFIKLNQLFLSSDSNIECSILCDEVAQQLNSQYGLSWEELEQLEITAIQSLDSPAA